MRFRLICLLLCALSAPTAAVAEGREAFFGTWGTDRQCARQPIKPGGTVMAEPFMIEGGWLRHGQVWCRLNWGPVEERETGAFAGAFALCGEDSVRSYLLRLELADEAMTLSWGVFGVSNGPLARCPVS